MENRHVHCRKVLFYFDILYSSWCLLFINIDYLYVMKMLNGLYHQYNSIYFLRPFVPNIGIELNMTLLYSMKILAHMSSYAHSTQYNLKYLFIPLPTFRTLFTFFRCDVMSRYKHERYLIMVIQITLYATTAYSFICMYLR